MKIFFLESLGPKHVWALYMGAHYTHQNTVFSLLLTAETKCRFLGVRVRVRFPRDSWGPENFLRGHIQWSAVSPDRPQAVLSPSPGAQGATRNGHAQNGAETCGPPEVWVQAVELTTLVTRGLRMQLLRGTGTKGEAGGGRDWWRQITESENPNDSSSSPSPLSGKAKSWEANSWKLIVD